MAQDVAKTISTQLASAPQEVAQACFLPVTSMLQGAYTLSHTLRLLTRNDFGNVSLPHVTVSAATCRSHRMATR
jgi:hypothetical protein